jgi:tRNA nucleotidyltransferase (CCA-adding enzyme)
MGRRDDFIRSLGVEAYRVGGSVRDEILGLAPKDDDYLVRGVTLSALYLALDSALVSDRGSHGKITPLRMRQGAQFGWRVSSKRLGSIDIALPRAERGTGDRQSMEVYVDPNMTLEEDAKRRDFTFNALYKTVGWQMVTEPDGDIVIDPTGVGIYDLQHRLIRTTHPESFKDDPLRILRALRFNARGFDLTESALVEINENASGVDGMTTKGYASGTLYDEFCKILMGERVGLALRNARDLDVLRFAMPELAAMLNFEQGSRYHDLTTDEHTFVALETAAHVEAPLRVRWALLFHDAGKPECAWKGPDGRLHYYAHGSAGNEQDLIDPHDGHINMDHEEYGEILWGEAAARMNVPARMRDDVGTLIREHMLNVTPRNMGVKVRRMRVRLGDELLRDLFIMRCCDLSGKGSKTRNMKAIQAVADMEQTRAAAAADMVPASRKELRIVGDDLMALGLRGRLIGNTLDVILDEVICDPSPLKLSREWQLKRAETQARHLNNLLIQKEAPA